MSSPDRPAAASPGFIASTVRVLEMIKFSHTLFALPFALMGAALAMSRPGVVVSGVKPWLGIGLCMVGARSAAMAFNRVVDRKIDAANPRTASRHIPAGLLKVSGVVGFTVVSCLVFIGGTALFLPENPWPLRLSLPVLAWLLGYSLAKRFTSLAHVWLGLALGMAPAAAWVALRGELTIEPVLLGLAVTFWVAGFDILYACQDYDFDTSAGLRSIPARFGVARSLRIAACMHVCMVAFLVVLGVAMPLGAIYFAGVTSVAGLLIYEHRLVQPEDLSQVNRAFFQVNIVISIGLLAVTLIDLVFS
ncbi:4-hydroxybenzoate octaprenyltransferase [bacterium]|nr:4-hydroxybenzoate octaprenyltransferase [bacterium]